MHTTCRNVNDAFNRLVVHVHCGNIPSERRKSRYGECLTVPEPVTITYIRPTERVLFNAARDANPVFHLYEALWMLAGRNDVAPLAYYNSKMPEFSDDGKTFNGAYGYRWRGSNNHFFVDDDFGDRGGYAQFDQLNCIVHHLRSNPTSRRAVLQMWNVEDDLLRVDSSRDVCCNLSVMFSLREKDEVKLVGGLPYLPNYVLDMTVTNRSNDMIWGMLGANYVHFTILQEYMAACIGVQVGVYHHFTNNLHVYMFNWKPEEWLSDKTVYKYQDGPYSPDNKILPNHRMPLVQDQKQFDIELPQFVERHSRNAMAGNFKEPFLQHVAQPMCIAFHHYKDRALDHALQVADNIKADDWRIATTEWLKRRKDKTYRTHPEEGTNVS